MPTLIRPAAALNALPPFKKNTGLDLRVDTSHNSENLSSLNGNMSNSPVPFIKNEPSDNSSEFSGKFSQPQFSDVYNGQYQHQPSNFGQGFDHIDPSSLNMSPDMTGEHQGSMPRNIPIPQHGGFAQSYPNFGTQNMGYMGISTAELLSLDLTKNDGFQDYANGGDPMEHYDLQTMIASHEMPLSHHGSGYSQTPDNGPSDSPFVRPFPGHHQFRLPQSYNSAVGETPSSYASPIGRSDSTQSSEFDNYMNTNGKRQSRHEIEINGSRKSPLSKSPNTPKTPGISGISLNGAESTSLPPQPIHNHQMSIHRHQKSLSSTQWDGTPSSQLSYLDSPLSSPGIGSAGHAQITEMMKSGKHASLPTKVESPITGGPSYQSQEAKKRRRRESHNMVERRRRDNINERIQELSHLVPSHRLEDEKIRKHLQSNSPLSPTITASGMSPPRATSMLAGGVGRRASGVGTQGLPGEEKDKGPNKGDILNGAVGWTRDLMWCLHEKLKQEEKVKEWFAQKGLPYPIEETEEEKRMRSEILSAIERNSSPSRRFAYSRAAGSGLRVPGFTDLAGTPVTIESPSRTTTSISPVHATGRNGSTSGVNGVGRSHSQSQFWPNGDESGMTFKEEEINSMDLT